MKILLLSAKLALVSIPILVDSLFVGLLPDQAANVLSIPAELIVEALNIGHPNLSELSIIFMAQYIVYILAIMLVVSSFRALRFGTCKKRLVQLARFER